MFHPFSSLTTKKAAAPVKFFDSSASLITDFHYGQLYNAAVLAKRHEATMTMYYAPWDLDSQRFKREYEIVAEHFDSQINFVAINCWWPDGECSKKLVIKRFPVLSAFLGRWGEVEYRGPLVASYVIPFLDNLLDPVTTINTDGDLLELRSKHDVSYNYKSVKNTCCNVYSYRLLLLDILTFRTPQVPSAMTIS